jgi:hypothetical protein
MYFQIHYSINPFKILHSNSVKRIATKCLDSVPNVYFYLAIAFRNSNFSKLSSDSLPRRFCRMIEAYENNLSTGGEEA